ncbi:hypothetical protein [Flavobacterium psychrophilum]|uniref:hypothetical protein n=1 Tax=Flavobacterium psychrophilum TaxID=96345 RepID=UPI000B7C55B2|nr:hypothetical protein [Flavobacterium psychrophilum]SNA74761.1 conserved exported hypothetical protein [Flavobacterium psychrophilum]
MNKTIKYSCIFFLIITNFQIFAQTKMKHFNCKSSMHFGDIEICLPEIDGMKECYKNPIAKNILNTSNPSNNPIFGYYLTDTDYSQIGNIENLSFDEYFTIFALEKMKNVEINYKDLNTIYELMEKGYIKENWSELKIKFQKSTNYLSFGKPVLIESYSLNNKLKTFVLLSKIQNGVEEQIQIQILNFIQIKKRLLSLSYYLDYNGEKSFKIAKSKNDYITALFLEENN